MTRSKSTKKALVSSILSLVLCFSMLMGTTYAWFTDTATTNVSTIQSGNFDITLVDADGNSVEGSVINFQKAEGVENEAILWEPGCAYNLSDLYVVNNGNLALKYQIKIDGVDGDSKLLEAIDWVVTVAGVEADLADFEGYLAVGEKSEAIAVSAHMAEEAGNEYQNLTLEGVSIVVVATQDTVEHDSIDNMYDEDATYPVASEEELTNALANGGAISVQEDIVLEDVYTSINKETTLNLDGKISSARNDQSNDGAAGISTLTVYANTTIGGKGTVENTESYGITVRDGELTINSGNFIGKCSAINVVKGTVRINGGFFEDTSDEWNGQYLINCIDGNFRDGSAVVIITGGTFVNFNPAASSAETGTPSLLAEGYTVVEETQANGDVWYTVVAE